MAALAQWVEREGHWTVPRGHGEEIAVDGEAFAIDRGDLWFKGCNTGAAKLICEMKKP